MTDLKKTFFKDLVSGSELEKEKKKRNKPFILQEIPISAISQYEQDGWQLHKKHKSKAKVKKLKPVDQAFEDKLWMILADMGFKYMNAGRRFKLPYSEDYSLTQQIDVIAIDDETILIAECKAAAELNRKTSFKGTIEAIGGKKEGLINTLKKVFPDTKYKIKFIFATEKYALPTPDIDRLTNFEITHFEEEEVEYYRELTNYLGCAAKYQLLGNLFEGKKIPELFNKVPAIRGKLGPYLFYFFSIEPEKLLKIGYVLHRTKANKELMPTYQRIVKKDRLKSIEKFVKDGGFFPNSIVISIDTKKPLAFETSNTQCEDTVSKIGLLHLPQKYRSAYIIDGQHRVYGYANSKYKNSNVIPVVAFENLGRPEQVELFMQINENQKSVSKNLRNTLNADLLWASSDLTEAIKALKLRIAQELGENKKSPLYEKVIIGENKKSQTKCITMDTIYTSLNRSNFFGTVTKDAIKEVGTFYDGNLDSTFQKLSQFLIGCLDYIKDNFEKEWELGEQENGLITINPTIYCLIVIISDITDHLVDKNYINPRSQGVDSLVSEVKPYLDPIIRYFKGLSLEEVLNLRRSYGSGGKLVYWRTLQGVINETREEFNPEGLEQWRRDNSKLFNTKSFEMIRDIETYIKNDVKIKLQAQYQASWWRKGVPIKVYEEAEALASKKNREIDDPNKSVDPWDQLHLIDYRQIILHTWRELFQQYYAYPEAKGDKAEKTSWLVKLNEIRNQNFHTYSVTEEEFNFLTNIHNWLLKQPR